MIASLVAAWASSGGTGAPYRDRGPWPSRIAAVCAVGLRRVEDWPAGAPDLRAHVDDGDQAGLGFPRADDGVAVHLAVVPGALVEVGARGVGERGGIVRLGLVAQAHVAQHGGGIERPGAWLRRRRAGR